MGLLRAWESTPQPLVPNFYSKSSGSGTSSNWYQRSRGSSGSTGCRGHLVGGWAFFFCLLEWVIWDVLLYTYGNNLFNGWKTVSMRYLPLSKTQTLHLCTKTLFPLTVNFGFPACPPTILRTMLTFLIRYCLDNNASPALPSSFFFPSPSPATPILKSIVFSTHENRELLHEILRQCLVLPPANPQYRDIVRGAIHIMGVWALSGVS